MVAVTGVVAAVALAALAALAPPVARCRRPAPIHDGAHGSYRPPPTQHDIFAVINGNHASIKACYQRALPRDQTLADGRVVLKLTIGVSGRVKHVGVEGPPRFRQLEPCLREVVGRWVFPQASEQYGAAFPLVFRAQELDDVAGQQVSVPETCSITVDSVPWSELWIDGKGTGRRTPVLYQRVPCGRHKLGLKRADLHIDRTEVIKVRPGKPFTRTYKLAAKP